MPENVMKIAELSIRHSPGFAVPSTHFILSKCAYEIRNKGSKFKRIHASLTVKTAHFIFGGA